MVSIIPINHGLTNLPLKISETDNGNSKMRCKDKRLDSFVNWQVPFISKRSLAEDGFYYTGRADIVRCAYCNTEIGKWEEGDSPNTEHKRWSPNCPFLKGNVEGHSRNVPGQGTDVCGNGEEESTAEELSSNTLSTLGVETLKPLYPKFSLVSKRLESFKDWPIASKQKPSDLATAGFYYNGTGDQTVCFYCGLGLKDWRECDDVWEEHALWSSRCTFVKMQKGLEFIKKVSNTSAAVLVSTNLENNKACSSLNIIVPNRESSDQTETRKDFQTKESPKLECTNSAPLCGICYTNERSILYLPCRHMIACVDCGSNATKCPVCRQEVKAFVKAILS